MRDAPADLDNTEELLDRARSVAGPPPWLCVVARGRDYAVIDKAAGMRSVPAKGADTDPALGDSVQSRIPLVFPEASGPLTVHRLDFETSGLIVVGLTREAHRALSRQFMHRKTGKSYTALLDGWPTRDEGEIDLPLIVDWPNRPRQHVNHERGKPAQTLFRITERTTRDDGRKIARVDFRPKTGRTHQLRVHAAVPEAQGGLGAPILGDPLYGEADSAPRLQLHAQTLAFWRPGGGDWVKFQSPCPF